MGGVDHLVGARAEIDEHATLLVDRRLDPAGRVDRMAVPRLAVPAKEQLVGRVEEQHVCGRARLVERVEVLPCIREKRSTSRIDHERDLLLPTLARNIESRRHECGREVVEGVVAEVLEDLRRLRFARARETCDDDEVRLTRGGQSGRIHDRTRPTIEITIAPSSAATNPSTWNPRPGTTDTRRSISALMTKWNRPSVRQVMGTEISSMIGRMNAFTMPRTRPVRTREIHLSRSPKPYDK